MNGINEWLVDQALCEPDIVGMFEGLCHRLHAIGIPLGRARLTWPTLHPLFQAETILWARGKPTEFEQFRHQETESDAWLRSPMKYMFDNDVTVLRRKLEGPDKVLDFPVLRGTRRAGNDRLSRHPDGAVDQERKRRHQARSAFSRPGRPTGRAASPTSELEALQKIQRRFAVACKTVIQARIARNISETYLGTRSRQPRARRLDPPRRRPGNPGRGLVQRHAQLHGARRHHARPATTSSCSTTISTRTATLIIEAGGEVLDFIGDGVLAIFPYNDAEQQKAAIQAATGRASRTCIKARDALNEQRRRAGPVPDTASASG